jgi:hypothetical protein
VQLAGYTTDEYPVFKSTVQSYAKSVDTAVATAFAAALAGTLLSLPAAELWP